jgi:hypothetical protein
MSQLLPDAVRKHYRRQQQRIVSTVGVTRAAWRRMSGRDLDGSWRRVGPLIERALEVSQTAAASEAAAYIPEVLGELGIPDRPEAELIPEGFAGAGDGRGLDGLLLGAVTRTKQLIAVDRSVEQALADSEAWLDMAVQTALADAERDASSVAIAVRPNVEGWVRMLNPPSCDRCVILAGRWYPWSSGFQRHPLCDCRMVPAQEASSDPLLVNPRAAVEANQVTGLSVADRQAILDGANPASVINAKRKLESVRTPQGLLKLTRTGSGRRKGAIRIRPETCYRLAAGDRPEAIRLLTVHGYIR